MTLTPDALFQAALRAHQAGDLARARDGYKAVLQLQPRHAHALHYLGIVTYQGGDAAGGIGLVERAVKLQPKLAAPHFNLGNMFRETGQAQRAEQCYRNVLRLEPRHAGALNNLAVLIWQRKALPEAEAAFRRLLGLQPGLAEAHANLGAVLLELGKPDEAIACLRQATALAPRHTRAHFNLGLALERKGDLAAAETSYSTAARLSPGDADILNNLANVLVSKGQHAEALAIFDQLVRGHPANLGYLRNFGIALYEGDRHAEAIAVLERGLALAPDDASLHLSLGNALRGLMRNVAAAAAYRRAIALGHDSASAHYNLGNTLRDLGEVDEALAAYGRALAHDGAHIEAWRARLSTLCVSSASQTVRFAEHRRFGASFAAQRRKPAAAPNPDPERPLRIAYVSSDLRQHPVGRNVELLLTHHDRRRFSLFCYFGARRPDAMATRLRAAVEGWHEIYGLSDDAVAALLRDDQVDILVLLAGRFDRNRPLLALRHAAPIQISVHDPATSGLEDIDYLVADRHLAPRRLSERFTERVLRLPSFYTHAAIEAAPPADVDDSPERPFTFSAFCHPAKLGAPVVALWGRILAQVPEARLQIAHGSRYGEALLQERLHAALCAAGAGAGQIEFLAERVEDRSHLARYRQVDVALDPFPFTGATSSFEALWMGVPVVTLDGDTMVGRWTSAMLRTLKMDEFIATDPDRYVDIAVALARDAGRRAAIRRSLRPRLAASPICNGPLRARQIERLYRAIWRRWCAGQSDAARPDGPLAASV